MKPPPSEISGGSWWFWSFWHLEKIRDPQQMMEPFCPIIQEQTPKCKKRVDLVRDHNQATHGSWYCKASLCANIYQDLNSRCQSTCINAHFGGYAIVLGGTICRSPQKKESDITIAPGLKNILGFYNLQFKLAKDLTKQHTFNLVGTSSWVFSV